MKNARIIKEIIDNNVITKLETIPVGASIARPCSKEHTIVDVGSILIAHILQRNSLKHNQAGITLIALVITIIILLILASITINLTLGERGIFNTAKKVVENYKSAEERESLELNNFEQETYNTINGLENDSIIIKQPVTSIKIEPENIKLKIGEKKTITATIEPANATNKSIEWKSGNTDIVEVGKQTINADGTVTIEMTGVGEGTTTITAKSKYGKDGKEVVGSSTVKVQPKEYVIFDYQKGGVQFELEYSDTSSVNGPIISNGSISGSCSSHSSEAWKGLKTKEYFDLTGYKYLYFESIFRGKYKQNGTNNLFGQLYIGNLNFFSTEYVENGAKYLRLPISSDYMGFYVDITGNEWNNTRVEISPKMEGDAVRLLKFTNEKPEGTYVGSLNDLN